MKKQSWEESEKRREEERRSEKRKSQKTDAGAGKGSKVAKHCVFRMICGSAGSKSRLAKAAGAEPSGEMRDEKLHAVVARCTFGSEKTESTSHYPEHFWQLWRGKSARHCGAKHIWQSKVLKLTGPEHFLEVEMLKKCTLLWCEAHLEVNCVKNWRSRTTFGSWDAEKVQNVQKKRNVRTTFGRLTAPHYTTTTATTTTTTTTTTSSSTAATETRTATTTTSTTTTAAATATVTATATTTTTLTNTTTLHLQL